MTRLGKRKEEEIQRIENFTLEMFIQLEKMLEMATILLDTKNNDIAVNLIEEDIYMDNLQEDLIVEINQFILKEQPKAKDLRIALGTYALSSDIERIGDHLKNFAKMMLKSSIEEIKHQKLVENLIKELGIRIYDTKEAYRSLNHQMAKSIAKRDEEIDELSSKLIADVNKLLEDSLDKSEVKAYTRIIILARTFERAGDHLVNVCEQISYIERGQLYNYS